MEHLDHPSPQIKDGKKARFSLRSTSSLIFEGYGGFCSMLFRPRLSEIHTGVTSSVTYGNHEMKTAFTRSKTRYYEKVHLVLKE